MQIFTGHTKYHLTTTWKKKNHNHFIFQGLSTICIKRMMTSPYCTSPITEVPLPMDVSIAVQERHVHVHVQQVLCCQMNAIKIDLKCLVTLMKVSLIFKMNQNFVIICIDKISPSYSVNISTHCMYLPN